MNPVRQEFGVCPRIELLEFICNENNLGVKHLVGKP
jgi:hypothetical protein